MQIKRCIIVGFLLLSTASQAQNKYFTKNGQIDFYSKTPLEDIEAQNRAAVCILDPGAGSLQFMVLIKGFEFEYQEMMEHFNEHYLESDKFPKAEFKGQIINNSAINYSKPGNYTAQVKGPLTIHGVTKEIQTNGNLTVDVNQIKVSAKITIQAADYEIKIPALVKNKIAKTIEVTINAQLEPMKR